MTTIVTVPNERAAGVCSVDNLPHQLFKYGEDEVCYKCAEPYVEGGGEKEVEVAEPVMMGVTQIAQNAETSAIEIPQANVLPVGTVAGGTGEEETGTGKEEEEGGNKNKEEEGVEAGGGLEEEPEREEELEEEPGQDQTLTNEDQTLTNEDLTVESLVCKSCGHNQTRMLEPEGKRKKPKKVCANCESSWKPVDAMKPLSKQGSVVVYKDRGPWGDSKYRGNTSGHLVRQLIEFYKPTYVFDPMAGGGTTGAVCEELDVPFYGRDIRHGHDENCVFCATYGFGVDFIFWHPPYHSMVKYGVATDFDEGVDVEDSKECNLSLQKGPKEFTAKLEVAMLTLATNVLLDTGVICVQIGDQRKAGKYWHWGVYVMQAALRAGLKLDNLVVKQQSNVTSAGFKYKVKEGSRGFIPINHEFVYCFVKKGRK